MNTKPPINSELQWIQALRGIAALMVLFFHMHPHWDLVPLLSMTSAVTHWGFSGVDIFFALSGFVVYRSAQRTIPARGAWPFIKRRLLRIYLGYWPVLLLVAFTTAFVYQERLPQLRKMVMSTFLLYPNIWDNWLPPAWSLTMEIYFYLWIVVVALLPQRHQVKAIVAFMALLAAWGVGWLIADTPAVLDGRQPLRYGLTGLGIEFLGGALLAQAYDSRSRLFSTPQVTIPVCTLAFTAGLILGSTSSYFDRIEVLRAASFGVMGLAALFAVLALEQTSIRPPGWLVRVGDASYSLYLLHTFLLDLSGKARAYWGVHSPTALMLFMLALPIAIVLISWLWYLRVERPIMRAAL